MSEVKPALTPEEWAEVLNTDWGRQVYANLNDHAAAAVGLHGQPFGFTHEDVELLRNLAEPIAEEWGERDDGYLSILALADRIASLLPPHVPRTVGEVSRGQR